ncbi:MAG: SMI1/KNR4 family protein [Peptococcaceae bacterium]
MTDLPSLTLTFAHIQSWMGDRAPGVNLRPPADPAALDNFSAKSGLSLPDDLRELLLIADGETRGSAGMVGNWRMLSIKELQASWGLLDHIARNGAFDGLEAESPPYIRKTWWDSGWIPVASNDMGGYFCLDTNPPEPERAGQVLLFLQDRPERPLVAGSLRAWFDRIARDLDADVYTYDNETGFNGEAFMWSALEGKHLFDEIEGKLMVKNDSSKQDPARKTRT